jgi:hypothetical protein
MCTKLIFAVLALGYVLLPAVEGASIIWVSDAFDESGDGAPDDQPWVDMLKTQGHTVDYTKGDSPANGYWRTLDDDKIAGLNAADLIIVSRCTSSLYYNNEDEPTQWNSLRTPLILLSPFFTRSNKWAWLNTITPKAGEPRPARGSGTPALLAVVPHHPIFKNVHLGAKNQVEVFDQIAGSGTVSFNSVADIGNGTLIAKPADQDWTFVAEWKAGIEFYLGSGQTPAGRRMIYAAGTREWARRGFGRGEYNLNAQGKKLFLNSIEYMLGNLVRQPRVRAWDPSPPHGTMGVTTPLLEWTAGDTAASHDVYFGTNPEPGPDELIGRQPFTRYFHVPDLKPETTYYWRIDEVEANGTTIHTGDVWSFTAAS